MATPVMATPVMATPLRVARALLQPQGHSTSKRSIVKMLAAKHVHLPQVVCRVVFTPAHARFSYVRYVQKPCQWQALRLLPVRPHAVYWVVGQATTIH